MNGWNLPAGCTEADIDVDQGVAAFCERCGVYYEIGKEETGLCPQCEEEENG